ncbi:MAG: T9SS type A sorting domain-containing protein [Lacibacter sp.]
MKKNFTLKACLMLAFLAIAVKQTNAQTTTINWGGTNGLNTNTGSRLSGTKTGVTVGTKTIDISYTITSTGNAPTFDDNGTGNVNRSIAVNWSNLTSAVTLEITFSKPVAIVSLPINNVDYDNNGGNRYNDRLEITGSNGINTTNNILQFGNTTPANSPATVYPDLTSSLPTFADNVAGAPSVWIEGENTSNGASDNISILTNSTLPGVSKLIIVFKSGIVGGGVTNPDNQDIQFLPFTISSAGTSNAPLPINFANVNAKKANGKVAISWTNLTESDVDYYEVEKSSDGRVFTAVGRTKPSANDYSSQNYQLADVETASTTYYRVKGVEYNGTTKYSSILKISADAKGKSFTVYPNPVANKVVTLQGANIKAGTYTVEVLSASGQQVLARTMNLAGGDISQSIELPASTKPGTYLLRVREKEVSFVTTLFVQ